MHRHVVVIEPIADPILGAGAGAVLDADVLARLVLETGRPLADWERLLSSPSLACIVGGSDDVREAHELAGKLDACGVHPRVVRVDDLRGAVSRMREASAVEPAPRYASASAGQAFRVRTLDGNIVDLAAHDLRALVTGRQSRRGHDEVFLAIVRSSEPLVIVVRAPGTSLDKVGPSSSPELALGELYLALVALAPGVDVERGLERPGASQGLAEIGVDDLAAAVAVSVWLGRPTELPRTRTGELPRTRTGELPRTKTGELPRTKTGELPRTKTAASPFADDPPAVEERPLTSPFVAPTPTPAPVPMSLELDESRRRPRDAAPDVEGADEPAPSPPPTAPVPRPRVEGNRAPRPPREAEAVPVPLLAKLDALRAEQPRLYWGVAGALVLLLLFALFGRGAPKSAQERLVRDDVWRSPYGVTFRFAESFDASVGGEHVVGMTVIASDGTEEKPFRISGIDATKTREAFGVPFSITGHDEQTATWIVLEARKPPKE